MVTPTPLVAPGTASITLPPFKAPTFTAAAVPVGGTITSLVFDSLSASPQTNVPFTFGQPFKQGDVAPTDALDGLQMDVKATHPDGSVRHAVISGVLASLLSGESRVIPLVRGNAKLPAAVARTPVSAQVELVINGVPYTASTDGQKTEAWFNGYFGQDMLYRGVAFKDAAGITHPDMTAEFSVRSYANTSQQRVDVAIEHTKAYTAVADVAYDAKLTVAGEVKYSLAGVVHFPCARWRKVVWSGIEPALHIRHNTKYLIESKAVANYDQTVVVTELTFANYLKALYPVAPLVSNFGPMKTGRFMAAMPTTGGRPDIGLAPDSYAAYILSMDKRAKDLMLASADQGGSWSGHRRDDSSGEAKGYPLDILHFPYATLVGTLSDSKNPKTGATEKLPVPVSSTKLIADTSHQPSFAYIPYLVTGDYYYLEELQFWANFNLYNLNPYYRQFEKGVVSSEQLRGQGWALRNQFQAAAITPDAHASKAIFQHVVASNLAYYNTTYTDCIDPAVSGIKNVYWNKLGTITNGYSVSYVVGAATNGINGTAPWMDDFFTQAIGHGYELGFTEAGRLLKWKSTFQLGRMIADGYCWTDAVNYSLRVRETATSPWYETLKQCHEGTFPYVIGTVCNTPERLAIINANVVTKQKLGEMNGYPTASAGYSANFQPALAMCSDVTGEDGVKAWKLFMARESRAIYTDSPQFAIVPRFTTAVPPPVVVVPPVVIVPPPVVVPPVVVPDTKVIITIEAIANLDKLTVMLVNGLKTTIYTNVSSNAAGVVEIVDKVLPKGVKYTATIFDSSGYTVASIFPAVSN